LVARCALFRPRVPDQDHASNCRQSASDPFMFQKSLQRNYISWLRISIRILRLGRRDPYECSERLIEAVGRSILDDCCGLSLQWRGSEACLAVRLDGLRQGERRRVVCDRCENTGQERGLAHQWSSLGYASLLGSEPPSIVTIKKAAML
jgi:hypothetical protein